MINNQNFKCLLKKDLITADSGNVKIALSIHSYSQLWLSAYGYKTGFPAEYNEMVK